MGISIVPDLEASDLWEGMANPSTARDLANALVGISATATGRAAYLDYLLYLGHQSAPVGVSGSVGWSLDQLLTRLTATRASRLDYLLDSSVTGLGVAGSFADYVQTLASRLSAARALYLDNLNGFAGSSYTATRATRLDYLLDSSISGLGVEGSIADRLNELVEKITGTVSGDYTAARASKIDNLDALISSRAAAVDWTTTRASRLDYLLDTAITGLGVSGSFADRMQTLNSRITGTVPLAADWTATRASRLDYLLDSSIAALGAADSVADYVKRNKTDLTTLLARITGTLPLASDYTAARAAKLDNIPSDAPGTLGLNSAGSFAATGTSYATALDITNKAGVLKWLFVDMGNTTGYVKLTVDGTALYLSTSGNGKYYWYLVRTDATSEGAAQGFNDGQSGSTPSSVMLHFRTSLKIEFRNTASANGTVFWSVDTE